MNPVIRRADLDDDDEAAAVLAADERHFSIDYPPPEREVLLEALRDLRAFVADDGGSIVGVAGSWPFSVTLPGPVRVPAAGVTWVGVAATHRRRGLLRRLLKEVHADAVASGRPLAVLTASEGSIYGRFGYGPATTIRGLRLPVRELSFVTPAPSGVRLRYGDVLADAGACRAAYDRYARLTPGEVDRLDGYWTMFRANLPRFTLVVAEEAGEVTGFARYSVRSGWDQGNPSKTLTVEDLVGVTDDARAALWRLVCSVDLVTTLETFRMPLDDPFPWTLANSRLAMTTHLAGHLWCAVLDVPAALSARRYEYDASLVLEVDHRRHRLSIRDGAGTCEPAEALQPDLSLDGSALGSLLLGGVSCRTLVRAGRVREHRAGAAAALDAAFTVHPAPFLTTAF